MRSSPRCTTTCSSSARSRGARATTALARRLLAGIGARLRALPKAQRRKADDSGMAGSTTRHVFPYPVARWLARAAPGEVEIAWREFAEPARLDPFLALTLHDAEREAFDSGEFATRAWVRLARRVGCAHRSRVDDGHRRRRRRSRRDSSRRGTTPKCRSSGGSPNPASPPRTTGSSGVPVVVRSGMRRPSAAPEHAVTTPLPAIELLSRARARRVVAAARAALAARCREVNAMTSPNLDEVWWCDLGEGTAMAVLGIAPDRRLTLETNTGYVLFGNGVPIGYGGVTPLFRQANTGINIFDPFRGSEAAFLWTQMLRAFHTLFGSTRFVVNAYQFGAGNAEARRSGAFWFYYRLGFRPAAPAARAVAAREAARLAADRNYRSGAQAMQVLLAGDLYLDLPGYERPTMSTKRCCRGSAPSPRRSSRANRIAPGPPRNGALRAPSRTHSTCATSRAGPRPRAAASSAWPRWWRRSRACRPGPPRNARPSRR